MDCERPSQARSSEGRGGRGSGNVTPELRTLEQQARSTRVGIWGGRDEHGDQAYSPSLAALNLHPREIRLGRFSNFDRADVGEDVLCEVIGHVVGQRRQRLILVGALDRNAEAPGVQRRAAFGAHDGVQLCLLRGGIAERGDVAGERHLHLPAAFAAEKRDRHVGDLKARLVRLVFRVPDQLLPLLHAFLEASRIRIDIEDGGPVEPHEFAILRPARLRVRRRRGATCKKKMSAARRAPLIVILISPARRARCPPPAFIAGNLVCESPRFQ